MTAEQVEAVRLLSLRLNQTVTELRGGWNTDLVRQAAACSGIKADRLRCLITAQNIDNVDAVVRWAGELRRPRRSTLVRLAAALELPPVVVDLWCKECPEAIAQEAKQ